MDRVVWPGQFLQIGKGTVTAKIPAAIAINMVLNGVVPVNCCIKFDLFAKTPRQPGARWG